MVIAFRGSRPGDPSDLFRRWEFREDQLAGTRRAGGPGAPWFCRVLLKTPPCSLGCRRECRPSSPRSCCSPATAWAPLSPSWRPAAWITEIDLYLRLAAGRKSQVRRVGGRRPEQDRGARPLRRLLRSGDPGSRWRTKATNTPAASATSTAVGDSSSPPPGSKSRPTRNGAPSAIWARRWSSATLPPGTWQTMRRSTTCRGVLGLRD